LGGSWGKSHPGDDPQEPSWEEGAFGKFKDSVGETGGGEIVKRAGNPRKAVKGGKRSRTGTQKNKWSAKPLIRKKKEPKGSVSERASEYKGKRIHWFLLRRMKKTQVLWADVHEWEVSIAI